MWHASVNFDSIDFHNHVGGTLCRGKTTVRSVGLFQDGADVVSVASEEYERPIILQSQKRHAGVMRGAGAGSWRNLGKAVGGKRDESPPESAGHLPNRCQPEVDR